MARRGYPGKTTIRALIDAGWFSGPRLGRWSQIARYRLDGAAMMDVPFEMRTPSLNDPRYSTKFSEVMIAAQALAMMGVRDADLTRGERPDLSVSVARRSIGLEVAEVTVSAHFTNAFTELNAEINDAIDRDPTLRPTCIYLHFSMGAGRSDFLPSPGDRRAILREVKRILLERLYETWEDGANFGVLPSAMQKHAMWVHKASLPQSPRGHVRVEAGATSFDPLGMVRPACVMLRRKQKLAAGYDETLPLWLVLGVTDDRGVFSQSVDTLARLVGPIAPFERVVVHDGMRFVSLNEAAAIDERKALEFG